MQDGGSPCNKFCFCVYFICSLIFLCPRDRRSRGILILPGPSFCPALWNFNLANNFWTVSARALVFHMNITDNSVGTIFYYPVILTLEFGQFFENVNLANNFWTASPIALIFNMSIPCDKTFPWEPPLLTLEFGLHSENFNIANNISTVSFHISHGYETFWPWHLIPWKKIFLSSWPPSHGWDIADTV